MREGMKGVGTVLRTAETEVMMMMVMVVLRRNHQLQGIRFQV